MTSMLTHHRIVVNGTTHHYVTAGEGRPLVLIHGFPQTWLQWKPLMERLASKFRIIAPDLRGLGGIPGPAGGYDKHSLAADVKAIVEAECGDTPITVCGHDMGAYVAFAYALNYRTTVDALVLVDAPVPGSSIMDQLMTNPRTWHIQFHSNVDVAHMLITGREREYISYFIHSRIINSGAITGEEIDQYAAAYRAPGALRASLELYRSLPLDRELNLSALQKSGKLEMPVVVVGCSMTSTEALLQGIADEISVGGKIAVVGPSGHWVPEEQPDQLAKIVLDVAATARGQA